MLDLDLLAVGEEADCLQHILMALGYGTHPALAERPNRHHLAPLVRRDTPGPIEIHRRAGNRYAEPLLPTRELESIAQVRLEARGQPEPACCRRSPTTSCMGSRTTILAMAATRAVSSSSRGSMNSPSKSPASTLTAAPRSPSGARRHPRLLAALDLWVVGAHELFAMPIGPPLTAAARRCGALAPGVRAA